MPLSDNRTDIEFRQLDVYDVSALREKFDIVLFMGVFYHLRHPLLALDLLHEHAVKETLVFQSMLRGSQAVVPLKENYPFNETGIFIAGRLSLDAFRRTTLCGRSHKLVDSQSRLRGGYATERRI